jgi:hypothetical protein
VNLSFFLRLATRRMRSSAWDTLSRFCARRVFFCTAFPLVPFAPPTPRPVARLCSSVSQLLWRSLTSRVRSSSATAPHLPDADQNS